MANQNKHFSENDRIFYSDGYKLAQNAILGSFSNKSLFSAIEALYVAIDELNDSLLELASRQNIPIDCKKGCQWCCHQAVFYKMPCSSTPHSPSIPLQVSMPVR